MRIDKHNETPGVERIKHPEWAKIKDNTSVIEALANPPEGYDDLDKMAQKTIRNNSRKKIKAYYKKPDVTQIAYPPWLKLRGNGRALEDIVNPPQGYYERDNSGQNSARGAARARIDRHNNKKGVKRMAYPEWCQLQK